MARVVVEAGIPSDVYEEAKKANLSWSKELTERLIEKLALVTKKERQEQTAEQLGVYNDAMNALTDELYRRSIGKHLVQEPIIRAKRWASMLREVNYYTTAAELIEDAKKKLEGYKQRT